MEKIIALLNFLAPLLTIGLTLYNVKKSRNVKKMNNETLQAKKRVEEISEAIENTKQLISNNYRIAQITELKEKTAQFQKIVQKYLKSPDSYNRMGFSIEKDYEEIQFFVGYLKQYSWLFSDESENHADILYNHLIQLAEVFERDSSNEIIHQQVMLVRSRIESFKSVVSKMHNDSVLS